MDFKLKHMLSLCPLEATLSLNLVIIFGGSSHSLTWHEIFRLQEDWEKRVVLTLVVNLEEV